MFKYFMKGEHYVDKTSTKSTLLARSTLVDVFGKDAIIVL